MLHFGGEARATITLRYICRITISETRVCWYMDMVQAYMYLFLAPLHDAFSMFTSRTGTLFSPNFGVGVSIFYQVQVQYCEILMANGEGKEFHVVN